MRHAHLTMAKESAVERAYSVENARAIKKFFKNLFCKCIKSA